MEIQTFTLYLDDRDFWVPIRTAFKAVLSNPENLLLPREDLRKQIAYIAAAYRTSHNQNFVFMDTVYEHLILSTRASEIYNPDRQRVGLGIAIAFQWTKEGDFHEYNK